MTMSLIIIMMIKMFLYDDIYEQNKGNKGNKQNKKRKSIVNILSQHNDAFSCYV